MLTCSQMQGRQDASSQTMFPLLRYFSIASFVALGVVTAIIFTANRELALSHILEMGEEDNVVLARSFANALWPRFSEHVKSRSGMDGDAIRALPETAELHRALQSLTRALPVLKVKIYSREGLTVYSSEESQIGKDESTNRGFLIAAAGNQAASELTRRGRFSAFSGEVYDRTIVESYVAIRDEKGGVEGVFELYSDVSVLISRLENAQRRMILGVVVIFSLLYGALFLIVRRASGVLKRQYQALKSSEESVLREKQQAESAARAKSEFLANMSHEIRTPMTAILGFADVLGDEDPHQADPERRAQAIETIRRNGQHLIEIIDGILSLSKLEAGRMQMERIAFSPTALAEEVISLMRVRSESKGLALELEVDSSTPAAAESDATRIRQILINLVGNAINFTDVGQVCISVGYRAGPAGSMLEYEVSDSGIGIKSGQIEEMFQPFTQGETPNRRGQGGTGLGLTICKRLASLLGGSIEVKSTPGEGSRFRVRLPVTVVESSLLIPEDDALSAPTETPSASAVGGSLPTGCRVLVAEDNRDNQRLIADTLQAAGAKVEIAENGAIAIEMVREVHEQGRGFDVVLMDMQMPVLDGPDAVRRLRSTGYAGPILALTAHAMPGDRQRCLEAGCDDYAAKPIDRRRLVELVARYVSGRDAG